MGIGSYYMKITDLSTGQSITIFVIIAGQQLEFESVIESVNAKKHTVYTTPVMKNDKVISFKGPGVQTHILVQLPDTKPLIFRNAIIATMKKEDGDFCYGVTASGPAVEFNRRNSYRCSIDIPCILKFGVGHATFDVFIRDVSLTGFSFVFKAEGQTCSQNQMVHVVLNDFIEELFENFSFHLYGIVVRIVELENGKVIYGCRLTEKIRGLDTYIAKKERLKIQRQRGTGTNL